MSEQTSMAPRKMEDQTYVVQRMLELPVDVEGVDYEAWIDVATVTVPARTLRKTVVEKALTEAGIVPDVGETMNVRVLDAGSAAVIPVGSVQPPPVLQIGESA